MNESLINLLSDYDYLVNVQIGIFVAIVFLNLFFFLFMAFKILDNKVKPIHIIALILTLGAEFYAFKYNYDKLKTAYEKIYNFNYDYEDCLLLLNRSYNDKNLINVFKVKCYSKNGGKK